MVSSQGSNEGQALVAESGAGRRVRVRACSGDGEPQAKLSEVGRGGGLRAMGRGIGRRDPRNPCPAPPEGHWPVRK